MIPKLGDLVHSVAQPIAKGIDSALGTNMEGCSGCAKRRQILNDFSDKLYDKFWKKTESKTMEYLVTKQYAVEASSPEEAIMASKDAPAISVSANPRLGPSQMQPPGPPKTSFPPRS